MVYYWQFPQKYLVRVEWYSLLIVSLVIFIFSWLQNIIFDVWMSALFALYVTLIFIGIYLLVCVIVQLVRQVEEHYHLHPQHLEIVRKSRFSQQQEKVQFKDVKHHKLDPFLLGGYIVTKKGKKHLLFFNQKKDLEKVRKALQK